MKKIVIVALALALCAGASAAEEAEEGDFRVDLGLGADICLAGFYPWTNLNFVWKPDLLGLGAGVEAYIGVNDARDAWLAPYLRLELGILYLAGGPAFLLTPLDRSAFILIEMEPNLGAYLRLGLAKAFLPLGPGKLGFDAHLGFSSAPIPIPDADNWLGAIVAAMAAVYVDIFASIKLGGGLTYSISF
jgi:hypothetical protein